MKLKVISLNLWGGILLEKATAFIKHEGPDVICLQDVYRTLDASPTTHLGLSSFHTLQKALMGYTGIHAPAYSTRKDGYRVEMGNAILPDSPFFQRSQSSTTFHW